MKDFITHFGPWTVVAGFLNRLITFSTRFAPRWMNSLIFIFVVGGMFKNVRHDSNTAQSVLAMASRTTAATE